MRVVLGLVALTFSWAAWAQNYETSATAWRTTDLDFTLTKTFINNAACDSSPQYLLSCKNALRAAEDLLSPGVSADEAARPDFESRLQSGLNRLPPAVPAQMFLGTAITAHLATFDAHAYLKPVQKILDRGPALGLRVNLTAQGPVVEEVQENSPAAGAGLKKHDLLLSGWRDGITLDKLVHLKVRREGRELEFNLLPAWMTPVNVDGRQSPLDLSMAVISIRDFVTGQTCGRVRDEYRRLKMIGATRFILDLRGNPGGDFSEALCAAGLFAGMVELAATQNTPVAIPETGLIHVYDDSPEIVWQYGRSIVKFSSPLVILTDAYTASSAELMAGSLQFHRLAWLVGERTYGKATVQTVEELIGHPSLIIAATSAQYFLPNLESSEGIGVRPNFEVSDNPYPPDSETNVWGDERAERAREIKECIARKNLDVDIYKALIEKGWEADDQQAYAMAVLSCEP
jgi:C-terminal processing protease CtpA/Prc